jgi:hypothetical protein
VTVGLLPQRNGTWTNDPENSRAVAAMAAARRELGDHVAFVLLGGSEAITEALETWTRLLAAEGLTDADVSLVFSEDSWGRWATLSLGPAGSMPQPAMLVVDPSGDVAAIFGNGLPTPAELRLVIGEATR